MGYCFIGCSPKSLYSDNFCYAKSARRGPFPADWFIIEVVNKKASPTGILQTVPNCIELVIPP